MFGILDMCICSVISIIASGFVYMFIVGASISKSDIEAYEEGYNKGYEDGKKVGGTNE